MFYTNLRFDELSGRFACTYGKERRVVEESGVGRNDGCRHQHAVASGRGEGTRTRMKNTIANFRSRCEKKSIEADYEAKQRTAEERRGDAREKSRDALAKHLARQTKHLGRRRISAHPHLHGGTGARIAQLDARDRRRGSGCHPYAELRVCACSRQNLNRPAAPKKSAYFGPSSLAPADTCTSVHADSSHSIVHLAWLARTRPSRRVKARRPKKLNSPRHWLPPTMYALSSA